MKKILLSLLFLIGGCGMFGLQGPVAFATVSSTTDKVIYTGDGGTTVFPFSFNIYRTSDLTLQTLNISTGAVTSLVLNTDYTVALTHTAPSPGNVTMLSILTSGQELVILRSIPFTQLINISDNSATPASVWNEGFDRGVMLAQQNNEGLSRSILQNAFNSSTLTFPSAVDGLCIGWSGTSLANLDCSGSGGGGGGGGSDFNPPIADSQLQAITTASKVNGSSIYSLSSIPSGAGLIPIANIPVGTTASKVVQLTSAAKYPAVDGSLITKLGGANFLNLSSIPTLAGVIPTANLPSLTQAFVPNNIQIFSTPGTATWTKPANIATVYVKSWGAGAGGGGADNNTAAASGGGGGAGGYSEGYIAVTGNVTVTIGTGGAGGTTGSTGGGDGTDGSVSSFAGTTTLTANGGSGGKGGANGGGAGGLGGAGGSASNGVINLTGKDGQKGGAIGGAGGNTFGNAGAPGGTSTFVTPTPMYGAGGGGQIGNTGDSSAAGTGGGGLVIVYY